MLIHRKSRKSDNVDEDAQMKLRLRLGYLISFVYTFLAIFFTLLVGLSVSQETADAILRTFMIQMAYDIFVSQPIRILIQYMFLVFLARRYCNNCRKVMLMILDANIKTSFI
jgi:hypothetical protein